MIEYCAINFRQKFGLFGEQRQPKVVAEMNDTSHSEPSISVIPSKAGIHVSTARAADEWVPARRDDKKAYFIKAIA